MQVIYSFSAAQYQRTLGVVRVHVTQYNIKRYMWDN